MDEQQNKKISKFRMFEFGRLARLTMFLGYSKKGIAVNFLEERRFFIHELFKVRRKEFPISQK